MVVSEGFVKSELILYFYCLNTMLSSRWDSPKRGIVIWDSVGL